MRNYTQNEIDKSQGWRLVGFFSTTTQKLLIGFLPNVLYNRVSTVWCRAKSKSQCNGCKYVFTDDSLSLSSGRNVQVPACSGDEGNS